ncbi:hypothetical protein DPMN_143614 [Dreissena polymorpha]|uniref:Uncharacterized protein n=1 Tax=Dreissena polymorpha TaxID=45954 RepID=A0A9D4GDF9_DREPO|nr:hypothetical protein DPMN_143614 [Dreissena polymorpha]
MDGSTDISGSEQESLYVRLSTDGQIEETIGSPVSTCSTDLFNFVNETFDKMEIPKEKNLLVWDPIGRPT